MQYLDDLKDLIETYHKPNFTSRFNLTESKGFMSFTTFE